MTGMNRSITNYFFLGGTGTLNAALLLLKEVQLHCIVQTLLNEAPNLANQL
jgi:hypothetical protein